MASFIDVYNESSDLQSEVRSISPGDEFEMVIETTDSLAKMIGGDCFGRLFVQFYIFPNTLSLFMLFSFEVMWLVGNCIYIAVLFKKFEIEVGPLLILGFFTNINAFCALLAINRKVVYKLIITFETFFSTVNTTTLVVALCAVYAKDIRIVVILLWIPNLIFLQLFDAFPGIRSCTL